MKYNTTRNKNVQKTFVTFHVGAGTFMPVRTDDITNHVMHSEWCDVPQETIDLVLKLRKEQKIGSKRIVWYLERYHGVTVSEFSVTRILTKHGMSRLKPGTSKRRLHSKR